MLRIHVMAALVIASLGLFAGAADAACQRGWVWTKGGCMPRGATDCGGSTYCRRGTICMKGGGCLDRNSSRVCPGGRSYCNAGSICTKEHTCLSIYDARVCGAGPRYCNRGFSCVEDRCVPDQPDNAADDCMSKDAETAIRGCTAFIRTEKDPVLRAKAHVNRGFAYSSKDQSAKAIAEYTEAIRLDPSSVLAYWNRGKRYEADDAYELALADAKRYFELERSLKAIAWRAHLHQVLQKDEEAIADYSVAIGLDPRNASLYARRAQSHKSLNRFDDAIADLAKAIEVDRTEVRLYDRAQLYFDRASYDKAIEDCTAAIAIDATYDTCFQLRGDAYLQKGDLANALADATKAISLAAASLRDADGEARFVTESITLPYMYALRGEIHERSGNKAQAIADYRKALEKYEDHPRAADGLKRLGIGSKQQ